MNAAELNRLHERARGCTHTNIFERSERRVECLDCGLFGKIAWSDVIASDEKFIDTNETPMGLMIVRKDA